MKQWVFTWEGQAWEIKWVTFCVCVTSRQDLYVSDIGGGEGGLRGFGAGWRIPAGVSLDACDGSGQADGRRVHWGGGLGITRG